ncbi:MAG: type II toxin-antitoxin system Phd/YefM family antitoxin [Thermoleophilia bacterium]
MKVIGLAEARKIFSRMIEDAHFRNERWVITKSGEPRVVLMSFDTYEELESKVATYEELSDPEAVRMDMIADADIKAGKIYEHEVVMAKWREQQRKRA